MQNSPKTIAFLASNGVDEALMSNLQRLSQNMGRPVNIKIISTEKALIQTWSGKDWGYSMAVNQKVDVALSADYDALVMCGSQRSLDKLGTNPHTKRFIEGFHATAKPMTIINEAVEFVKDILLEDFGSNMLMIEDVPAENMTQIASQMLEFIVADNEELSIAA